ncbi:MAG: hypothetical protein KBA40_00910 [Candidatus Peribacteraceae bacterium]|nr:hypothetical protein [Candidatus Peribacteraceae bacterium]MBP9850358.1 hypothetical protein [Candidatus Peribacteraceae bacterium]
MQDSFEADYKAALKEAGMPAMGAVQEMVDDLLTLTETADVRTNPLQAFLKRQLDVGRPINILKGDTLAKLLRALKAEGIAAASGDFADRILQEGNYAVAVVSPLRLSDNAKTSIVGHAIREAVKAMQADSSLGTDNFHASISIQPLPDGTGVLAKTTVQVSGGESRKPFGPYVCVLQQRQER